MTRPTDPVRRPDNGFTLIEVLIVTITMGLIVTSLALVVATVLRTSPGAEARDDDSRTLLGLATYLPEDVNSTPPGGFDYDKTEPTGCTGNPPGGVNLVRLTWTESTSTTSTFRASYRYVNDGSGYRIVRYACRDGQAPSITKMTSVLPSIDENTWAPGTAPAAVATQQVDGEDIGLSITVKTIAGDEIYLEMFSNNPDNTLPAVPPGFYPIVPAGNQAPTAQNINVQTLVSTAVDVGMSTYASDPDGDGTTISFPNIPTGWTANVSGTTLTVTPPGTAPAGTTAEIDYLVTDPYGQFASAKVKVAVVLVLANQPPIAADHTAVAAAKVPLVINLPASDPDGNPLTTTISNVHPSLTVTVNGPTQITVTSDGTQITPPPFSYTVSDKSLSVTRTVNITVTTCNITSLTPATTSVGRKNNGRLKNNVAFAVTYSGPCSNLVLEYSPDNTPGQATFLSFGAGNSVTIAGNPGGQSNWTLGAHTLTLRSSQTGPSLRTATLTVTS